METLGTNTAIEIPTDTSQQYVTQAVEWVRPFANFLPLEILMPK